MQLGVGFHLRSKISPDKLEVPEYEESIPHVGYRWCWKRSPVAGLAHRGGWAIRVGLHYPNEGFKDLCDAPSYSTSFNEATGSVLNTMLRQVTPVQHGSSDCGKEGNLFVTTQKLTNICKLLLKANINISSWSWGILMIFQSKSTSNRKHRLIRPRVIRRKPSKWKADYRAGKKVCHA